MHAPKAPAADPAVAAAQAREQARAEAGQISQTQAGLSSDTNALRRRFGTMAASMSGNGAAGNYFSAAKTQAGGTGFGAGVGATGFQSIDTGLNSQGFWG